MRNCPFIFMITSILHGVVLVWPRNSLVRVSVNLCLLIHWVMEPRQLSCRASGVCVMVGIVAPHRKMSYESLPTLLYFLAVKPRRSSGARLTKAYDVTIIKDIVTHTQKYKTVKCTFCGVWVPNFVWNFKGALWNFTQNFEPIHRKMCILRGGKNLTTYDILKLWHLKS